MKSFLGKAVTIGVLILAVYLLIQAVFSFGDPVARMPVISLLQKVQYMEELELNTLYTDHILLLGDPSGLQKLAEQAADDSLKAYKAVNELQMKMGESDVKLAVLQQTLKQKQSSQDELKFKMDSASKLYQEVAISLPQFRALLSNQNNAVNTAKFGANIASAWSKFDQLEKNRPSSRRDRKTWRQQYKDAEGALNSALVALKQQRFDGWKALQKQYKDQEGALDIPNTHTSIKKEQANFNQLHTSYEAAKLNLQSTRKKAYNAFEAAKKALAEQGTLDEVAHPKLLAVLPTHVTTYFDLSKIVYTVVQDTLVNITVDSIFMGKVYAEIDSAKHYNVAKPGLEIQEEPHGLYEMIFDQIRMEMGEIETQVKAKAVKGGIMKASCKTIEDYFKTMVEPLGYKVAVTYRSKQCCCE